jgi:hypothetical protein
MAGDAPGSSNRPRSDRGQLEGSFLLNSILVAAIAATIGVTPAVLFHDYGGTLLVIAFLFGFLIFVQRWILGTAPSDEIEVVA